MPRITKDHAIAIAKKLGAELVKKSKRHDIALVSHEGKPIASFGIRRSSRRDIGHSHIPRELQIQYHQALLLGQCPWSRDDYITEMKKKGNIE